MKNLTVGVYSYDKETGTHIWNIPIDNSDFFKRYVIKNLLFFKENHIDSLVNMNNITNSEDYWNAVARIANNILNSRKIELDMNIMGCKSFVSIDFKDSCSLSVCAHNSCGYEEEMVSFINDCINNI